MHQQRSQASFAHSIILETEQVPACLVSWQFLLTELWITINAAML